MPPKKIHNHNRNIRDFFKPYTVPKHRDSTSDESSPFERTPNQTPPRVSSASPSSTADNALFHSSPSPFSAPQRKMAPVAVPSPTPPRRSPSPITAPESRAPPATQPSRSFPSFSTLSSNPQSSGSSRRVICDGLPAVINSDSDSDTMDELADLDSFMPRKKMKMTPPLDKETSPALPPSNGHDRKKRGSDRLATERGSSRSTFTKPKPPQSPPRPTYRFSLAKMAADSRNRQEAAIRIAEAEAAVEAAAKLCVTEAASATSLTHLDAAKLTEMFDAEEDENQRTILALARTEALERQETFSYFKDQPRKAKDADFPHRSLPPASWAEGLDDMETREQACLSGWLADLASCNMLNKEVTTWFAQQLIYEPREELCEAYVEIIRAATEHAEQIDCKVLSTLQTWYWTTVSTGQEKPAFDRIPPAAGDVPMSSQPTEPPEDVVSCICGVNEERGRTIACDNCDTWQHSTCYYPEHDRQEMFVDFEHQCVDCKPRKIDKAAARRRQSGPSNNFGAGTESAVQLPDKAPGLPFVARVLQYCASIAGTGAIGQAICDLALANNDDFVRERIGLRQALSDAIEALCDAVQPQEVEKLYKHAYMKLLTDEKLSLNMQARLVASLPATSTQVHVYRRRLALYLVTRSQKSRPLTSREWVGIMMKRLKTAPEYSMSEQSDYDLILNLISILDIAIDAGFSDFAFLDEVDAKPVKTGPFGKSQPAVPEEEKAFNKDVDLLSDQIKRMASRIMGAGATHLRRVEAKSALERLRLRLEYGVRTRPKPRKGVFGEFGGDRETMEGFVETLTKDQELGDDVGGAGDRRKLPERPSPMKKRVDIVDPDATITVNSGVDDSFHTVLEQKDEMEREPEGMPSNREMSDQADEEGFHCARL